MTNPQFRNSTVRVHHEHGSYTEANYKAIAIVLFSPRHEDPGGIVLDEKSVAHKGESRKVEGAWYNIFVAVGGASNNCWKKEKQKEEPEH